MNGRQNSLAVVAVFLSAALLFQLQPMFAKIILPRFGGVASVWTTCLLAFQFLLLAGYAYVDVLRRFLSVRPAWMLHMALLCISLVLLPRVSLRWIAYTETPLTLSYQVFFALAVNVGLPFVLLSATSPMFQWNLAESSRTRSPYWLYASSNLGSLLGLMSYPVLVEPFFGLTAQTWIWTAGYLVLMAFLGIEFRRIGRQEVSNWGDRAPDLVQGRSAAGVDESTQVTGMQRLREWSVWIFYSAGGCLVLMASSALLTQEVAAFPFLWTVPLALYLISLVIAFGRPAWYRPVWLSGGFLLAAMVGLVLFHLGTSVALLWQILGLGSVCFLGTMICHGEMERRKPVDARLTEFYFATAGGGLLGGVICVLFAPQWFVGFFEFHLALLWVLLAIILGIAVPGMIRDQTLRWGNGLGIFTVILVGIIVIQSWNVAATGGSGADVLFRGRNEYGTVSVTKNAEFREIVSGQTGHGRQYLAVDRRLQPQDYYAADSGLGLAVRHFRKYHQDIYDDPDGKQDEHLLRHRWAIIGLGSGCLTTWARPGDAQVYYELNPQMVELAKEYFTYLKETKADITIVEGDGRLMMQQEFQDFGSQRFDIVVVDAFTSDSIPTHLLTDECLALYQSNLRYSSGLVAIHITNRFVDLAPVFAQCRIPGVILEKPRDPQTGIGSRWVILTENEYVLSALAGEPGARPLPTHGRRWTDDYSSLFFLVDWTMGFRFSGSR